MQQRQGDSCGGVDQGCASHQHVNRQSLPHTGQEQCPYDGAQAQTSQEDTVPQPSQVLQVTYGHKRQQCPERTPAADENGQAHQHGLERRRMLQVPQASTQRPDHTLTG